jgi:hypothetical protein
VSVGYKPLLAERYEREDKCDLVRIVKWQPMDLSLVPIPADAGAQVRSGVREPFTLKIKESRSMKVRTGAAAAGAADDTTNPKNGDDEVVDTTSPAGGGDEVVEQPTNPAPAGGEGERGARKFETPALDAEAVQRAMAEGEARERLRAAGIITAAEKLGLKRSVADKLIADKVPLEAARAQLIDAAAEADDKRGIRNVDVTITRDADETRAEGMLEAMLHRYDPGKHQITDKGRQYRSLSLLEMARECLGAAGVDHRNLSRAEVAKQALQPGYGIGYGFRSGGMMTTSDFSNLVGSVGQRTLRDGYAATTRTFETFARRTTAPDFRAMNRISMGDAPKLEKVNEHGEYKRGALSEAVESYRIETWGKVVPITRQVIVNDDLDAFTRLPQRLGASAANLENDVVYSLILANAAMGDGTALFHSNHGNLAGSGAAPSVATLGTARTAMRMQVGLGGASALNIAPAVMLVPASLEVAVAQLFTTITPAQTSNAIPDIIRNGLQVVSEPRLDTGVTVRGVTYAGSLVAWYLFADKAQYDTVEYAYLEGDEAVRIETRNGFDIDGVEIKASMDFGAKFIDWRGVYKNPGV